MHKLQGDEDGNWLHFNAFPIGDDAYAEYLGLGLADGSKLYELSAAKMVSPNWNVGLRLDFWDGTEIEDNQFIGVDYAKDNYGIGLIKSFPTGMQLTWRLSLNERTTIYQTLIDNQKPKTGISYRWDKVMLEFSKTQTWNLNVWQTIGKFEPDLRLNYLDGDLTVGFGLGYYPN